MHPEGEKYTRNIESMGEGLVLFKLAVDNKRIGQNYHFFFEDKRKPPLDIAINPDYGTLEYVSYFLQDEKIVEGAIRNKIVYKKGLIIIKESLFNEKNTNIMLEGTFKSIKSDNDIYILNTFSKNQSLQAYQVDNLNYLLFSNNSEFCGVIFKEISKNELGEIINSRCI